VLSVADAEALVIARADEAVLLTGDGSLRKAALDVGVDVRGVIGELKRLVAAVVIDPPGALTALETIVASGSRLPHDEVAAARRQWFKMIVKGRGPG
jgi:predicted nucleic acid-binding protein